MPKQTSHFILFVIILLLASASLSSAFTPASYDQLDPRYPAHKTILLQRLQAGDGEYLSISAAVLDAADFSEFDKQLYDYIYADNDMRFRRQFDDLRLKIGLQVKEDWLGISEDGNEASHLQSLVSMTGEAWLKDRIQIVNQVTFYRSDSTYNLDEVSVTGDFLHNPLISYQFDHRAPIASAVDVGELQADRAYLKTNVYGVSIQTGRDRIQLRNGYRNTLLLSGLTRPIDLYYRLEYGFWRLNIMAMSGQLTDDGEEYISAKRVTFRIAKNLQLGVTEAVKFDGDPLAYINPIMLFYITHRHRPTNKENLIASFDISYTPVKDFNLYFEFLDDDLIVFEGGASKYGFLFGLLKSRLISERIDLRAEYSHVRKWTYTHVSYINSWEYRGQTLGSWLGNDADDIFLQMSYLFSPSSLVRLNFAYTRKGEGDLYEPYEDVGGDKKPPFPSGIVEKAAGIWADFRYEFKMLTFDGRVGYRSIENPRNQPGDIESLFTHWAISYNY